MPFETPTPPVKPIEDIAEAHVAADAEARLRNVARSEHTPLNPEEKAAVDKLAAASGEKASNEYFEERISLEADLDIYNEAYGCVIDKATEASQKLQRLVLSKVSDFESVIKTPEGNKLFRETMALQAAQRALTAQDKLNQAQYKELTGGSYSYPVRKD